MVKHVLPILTKRAPVMGEVTLAFTQPRNRKIQVNFFHLGNLPGR